MEIPNSLGKKEIDKRLYENGLDSILHLFEYQPKYSGVSCSRYFDHGVFSSVIMLELQKIFSSLIEELQQSPSDKATGTEKILRLGLGVGIRSDDILLEYENNKLLTEAAFAVCLHNLKPEFFKDVSKKKFRTEIQREPFAFLSILADNLQPWDRERIINQALKNLPYSTYGDGFDLEIKGNTFNITETGDNLEIEKRIKEIRNHLNSYLKDAGHMIKLNLSEWKHL